MLSYFSFIGTALLLILSPGIDTALVTKNTITNSAKGGLFTAIGISTGVVVHTLFTALGLSVILMQSSHLFHVVKIIGAIYLIYLGVGSFRKIQHGQSLQPASYEVNSNLSYLSLFRQGLITNVLNPKVALFFFTFLPQFVSKEGIFFYQILLLGFTYATLTLAWFLCYLFVMGKFEAWFKKSTVQLTMEKVTGAVLVFLGLKLMMTRS